MSGSLVSQAGTGPNSPALGTGLSAAQPGRIDGRSPLACPRCANDAKALQAWRREGGEMPSATCTTVHGRPCRTCKEVLLCNHDGRCDPCALKREQKVRPMAPPAARAPKPKAPRAVTS